MINLKVLGESSTRNSILADHGRQVQLRKMRLDFRQGARRRQTYGGGTQCLNLSVLRVREGVQ